MKRMKILVEAPLVNELVVKYIESFITNAPCNDNHVKDIDSGDDYIPEMDVTTEDLEAQALEELNKEIDLCLTLASSMDEEDKMSDINLDILKLVNEIVLNIPMASKITILEDMVNVTVEVDQ